MQDFEAEVLRTREELLKLKQERLELLRLKRERAQAELVRLVTEEKELEDLVGARSRTQRREEEVKGYQGNLAGLKRFVEALDVLEDDIDEAEETDSLGIPGCAFDEFEERDLDRIDRLHAASGALKQNMDVYDDILGPPLSEGEVDEDDVAGSAAGEFDIDDTAAFISGIQEYLESSVREPMNYGRAATSSQPRVRAGQSTFARGATDSNNDSNIWVCTLCMQNNIEPDTECSLCGELRFPSSAARGLPQAERHRATLEDFEEKSIPAAPTRVWESLDARDGTRGGAGGVTVESEDEEFDEIYPTNYASFEQDEEELSPAALEAEKRDAGPAPYARKEFKGAPAAEKMQPKASPGSASPSGSRSRINDFAFLYEPLPRPELPTAAAAGAAGAEMGRPAESHQAPICESMARADSKKPSQVPARDASAGIVALASSSGASSGPLKPNANPLGSLQLGGDASVRATIVANHKAKRRGGRGPTASQSALRGPWGATLLSRPVQLWADGDMSGAMAAREILDKLFVEVDDDAPSHARDLSMAAQLYSGRNDAIGGVLGALSGGLPHDSAEYVCWLNSKIFSREPDAVTREAVEWLCGALGVVSEDEDGDVSKMPMSRLLGRLMEVPHSMISLVFSCSCLQDHPHRAKGSLQQYIQRHVYLELIRRCWAILPQEDGSAMGLSSSRFDASTGVNSTDAKTAARMDDVGHVSDATIRRELSAPAKDIVTDTLEMSPQALAAHNKRVDRYIEYLTSYKQRVDEQLQSLEATSSFAVLGAHPDMTDKELAKCYRTAILSAHPDKKGGSKQQFERVRGAYKAILRVRKASKNAKNSKSFPAQTSPAKSTPTESDGKNSPRSAGELSPELATPERATPKPAAAEPASAGPRPNPAPLAEKSKPFSGLQGAPSPNTAPDSVPEATASEATTASEVTTASEAMPASLSPHKPAAETNQNEIPKSAPRAEATSASAPSTEATAEQAQGASSIQAEHISLHAELAAHGAQMCIKVAKAAAAALVMGEEDDMKSLWYPVAKCAAHIVEMADHVVNSAQTVGRAALMASDRPTEAVKLVTGSRVRSKRVASEALKLLQATKLCSEQGKRSLDLAAECAASMERMSQQLLASGGSASAQNLEKALCATADIAREAAAAAMEAATCAGVLQDTTTGLLRMFERAKRMEEAAADDAGVEQEEGDEEMDPAEKKQKEEARRKAEEEKQKREEAERKAAEEKKKADEAAAGAEGERKQAAEHRLRNRARVAELNAELLEAQARVRGLVYSAPELLSAVSVIEKKRLFRLVRELVADAMGAVSQAWLDTRIDSSRSSAWCETVRGILEGIIDGVSPGLAVPRSLNARIYRQAALVDTDLVVGMVCKQLRAHTLTFKPKDADKRQIDEIREKFDTVAQALRAVPGSETQSA